MDRGGIAEVKHPFFFLVISKTSLFTSKSHSTFTSFQLVFASYSSTVMDMNMMIMEPKWSYDVFLCFRGPDTRCTFTANLYHALRNKRFKAFMYERELRSGDEISPTLLRAIEESRVSVVVLSQDFASSTWCLNELVAILECKRKKSQLVLPIFYDVDPSRIRHQRGTYGEAMAVHKSRFGEDAERVQIWSSALSQVANLTGWHFKIGYVGIDKY